MVLPEGFEPSKIDPKSIVISISPWEQNDNFFMGIIEPQNMCSEDHCAIHYTMRANFIGILILIYMSPQKVVTTFWGSYVSSTKMY